MKGSPGWWLGLWITETKLLVLRRLTQEAGKSMATVFHHVVLSIGLLGYPQNLEPGFHQANDLRKQVDTAVVFYNLALNAMPHHFCGLCTGSTDEHYSEWGEVYTQR